LNAGYAAALKKSTDDQAEWAKGLDDASLTQAAQGMGAGTDPARQAAAINRMISSGKIDQLRVAQDEVMKLPEGTAARKIMERQITENYSTLKEKAGDITAMNTAGGGTRKDAIETALKGMSAETYSKQHKSFFSTAAAAGVTGGDADRLGRAVGSDQKLSNNLTGEQRTGMESLLSPAGGPMPVPAPPKTPPPGAIDVSADGKYYRDTPAGPWKPTA
jgi:hypothetical protein